MNRRAFLSIGAVSAALAACSSTPEKMMDSVMGKSDALLNTLSTKLGVSETQAAGGVGSMMSLAKSKLSPESFSTLTKGMPGVDGYIKTAQEVLGPNMKITDLASLKSAFSRFGMGPDMIGKFKPYVTDALGKVGGDSVKQLLGGVLG